MKSNHKLKSVISMMLTFIMILGTLPGMTVFAAQKNDYADPADNWLVTNSRTNELDINATITYETLWCTNCNMTTSVMTYRVPEYTKSGTTALNRGVMWSDGTLIDGSGKGNLDDGTPGVDAYYTGYHWTKSLCQHCGILNTVDGPTAYCYNKNVYSLNSCDHSFFIDYDNTTYEQYDDNQHTTVVKKGNYCQFCKGTFARATTKKEAHNLTSIVDGQVANNRFFMEEYCEDCGYRTNEYVTAKAVVSSYYGNVDGTAHTLSVTDLSDDEVHTRIRYGTEADNCTLTSAPNYTEAGYYPVYYEIDYKFEGETMTENGVSYVWLLEAPEERESNSESVPHVHDYRYLETVKPTCLELGYERWQCSGCGNLLKQNYTQALGHNYKSTLIREATCTKGGMELEICTRCGDFHEHTTALADHEYEDEIVPATCKSAGYTKHICKNCGNSYITDITDLVNHAFTKIVRKPDCINGGYTTYICNTCHISFTDDYTDALGHSWDEGHNVTLPTCEAEGVIEYNCENCNEKMIKSDSATGHTPGEPATCTEPQICTVCETVLELPTGHTYSEEVIDPTCTTMGYSIFTCDCGDTYIGNYTDMTEHDFVEIVTAPTCTEHGFSTFKCADCDAEYISNYTDKLDHKYTATVTPATCTSMGYSTYVCDDCGETYKADYTDMLEHNYNKQVIEPTCEEHGYAVYTCPDCGKEFIADYTDVKQHTYTATVTPATCTSMGYTTYVCDDCGESYVGDYTDKLPHNYVGTVTEPTCVDFGFTTYVCADCGESYKADYTDKLHHNYVGTVTEPTCLNLGYTTFECADCHDTYKAEYKEALGHTPSEWIVDIEATINHAGEKHIECTVCGERLMTAAIAQLVGRDFTDEDGNAVVGAYSIRLSDKNDMPVWNAEITIDVNDNVLIKLPDGRLLDFEDQTTIEVKKTETGEAKEGLAILTIDKNGNNATGKTNTEGILKVPNDKSSTGDDNGTIGNGDDEVKNTYVVTVTDKANVIIPNCDIRIGESNNIVVDLPDGIKPTRENPVIVTVVDQNGTAKQGVTVIAMGDADFIEKGITDIYGRITLPTASDGYTDENGMVNVDNINVIVNDEFGVIPNAYVKHNEDGTINVTLPDGKSISYANRITVTVLDSMGNAVSDVNVTVSDLTENTYTDNTDENGGIVVPPVNTDMTDSEGKGVVNGYNVLIADETKPIENAYIEIVDGKITVKLPEGVVFDYNNRITATVTDKDNAPVKDMSVTFTDSIEKAETNLTDENGKATVPPTYIDYTDINGYSEVDGYIVTVICETGSIEKAQIIHNAEELNGDGSVKVAENIAIELPEDSKFDYANRITVTVLNKADNTSVAEMTVNISELPADDAEAKVLNGKTNASGKVVFPPMNEDITDENGDSGVTEEKPGKGEDTDGDGVEDKPGEVVTTTYIVKVNDTKGIINGAFVEIKDGKVYVTLPETHTLTTSNQTTVTVLDKDNKAVSGVWVTVKDATTEKSATTNANGQITVPVKTSSGGSSSGGSSGGGGGGSIISTVNVKVVDKDGKTVTVSKSTGTDKVTLTLPTGKNLAKDDNYYTITVTDRTGNAKADYEVILKDRNNNEVTGKTNADGILILPAEEHKAYIVGYDDGTFRPDSDMTRAEAVAIFARLIAEDKGETVSGKKSFIDVNKNAWYYDYVGYLAKYDIINGYTDGTFKPDESVTRAEFVAMAVRYYGLFNEVKNTGYTVKYTDLDKNYWAYNDIALAKNIGWLNGYADGTFRGDNNITRAEVVTIVNRATGRTADKEYVKDNLTKLNRFTDVTNSNLWYFMDVHEAANTHMANTSNDAETWVK